MCADRDRASDVYTACTMLEGKTEDGTQEVRGYAHATEKDFQWNYRRKPPFSFYSLAPCTGGLQQRPDSALWSTIRDSDTKSTDRSRRRLLVERSALLVNPRACLLCMHTHTHTHTHQVLRDHGLHGIPSERCWSNGLRGDAIRAQNHSVERDAVAASVAEDGFLVKSTMSLDCNAILSKGLVNLCALRACCTISCRCLVKRALQRKCRLRLSAVSRVSSLRNW